MAIPFHVMAMVIQNLGFRWRSEENQEHFLKEQNYNNWLWWYVQLLSTTSDLNDILHCCLTCVAPGLLLRSTQTFPDIKLSDVAESHLNLPR